MTNPAERLTKAERIQTHPNRRPVDAATLLILDSTKGGETRVLMGRRHMRHTFLPGKFVFPGGRVDVGDSRAKFGGDYHERVLGKLMQDMKGPKTAARARAFSMAAIRETYEETGVFVANKVATPLPAAAGSWAAFSERALLPDLSGVRFISRAITPPRRPRRFDTRFLVVRADAIGGQLPEGTGPSGELEEVDWLTLSEAKTFELPTITQIVIEELEERLKSDPKLSPDAPVPFYFWRGKGFEREMI